MQNSVTLTGSITSDILQTTTKDGAPRAVFRLVTFARRRDPGTGSWITGPASYVTVTCARHLALHVVASLNRGDPVIVAGRLRVLRDKEARLSRVELEAACVAPDLNRVRIRIERSAAAVA